MIFSFVPKRDIQERHLNSAFEDMGKHDLEKQDMQFLLTTSTEGAGEHRNICKRSFSKSLRSKSRLGAAGFLGSPLHAGDAPSWEAPDEGLANFST